MPRRPLPGGPGDRARLAHMLEAARDATQFISGRIRSELQTDRMLCRAVVHALQEIGEAAARTSETGRARVPGVPWGQIIEMRNIIVHIYWGVDLKVVWDTATKNLAPLIAALESALAAWPE